MTPSQVKNGLRDRNSLEQFLNAVLGYRTSLVAYENPTEELRIPPDLSTRINGWWLMSSYPGRVPFQIHFAEVQKLTFYLSRSIADFFMRRHPGNYLFMLTHDYCHLVLFSIERSLERRANTFILEPKPYYRYLIVDCSNPSSNALETLAALRLDPSLTDPDVIHQRVLTALKRSKEEIPEWFMEWYYRLGYSQEKYERLRELGLI